MHILALWLAIYRCDCEDTTHSDTRASWQWCMRYYYSDGPCYVLLAAWEQQGRQAIDRAARWMGMQFLHGARIWSRRIMHVSPSTRERNTWFFLKKVLNTAPLPQIKSFLKLSKVCIQTRHGSSPAASGSTLYPSCVHINSSDRAKRSSNRPVGLGVVASIDSS